MMGVPIDGYCHTFVDNNSVISNSSMPESTLKKKSNSVAYNYCRSKCAADVFQCQWIPSDENPSDMLTKIQPGTKRAVLQRMVMYPGCDDSDAKREIKAMNLRFKIYD